MGMGVIRESEMLVRTVAGVRESRKCRIYLLVETIIGETEMRQESERTVRLNENKQCERNQAAKEGCAFGGYEGYTEWKNQHLIHRGA